MSQTIRDAWFLARFGIWHLLRTREVILWTVVMPVVFYYFIGMVNRGGSGSRQDVIAVMAAPDAGILADHLIARLKERDYRVDLPKSEEEFQLYRRRLRIPASFTAHVMAGTPVKLDFSRTGDDPGNNYDSVRVNRALYTTLADYIVVSRGGPVTADKLRALAEEPHPLTLDVKAATKRIEPPTGYEQSVPGTMVMFTLTVMFTVGAVSLTIDRRLGILRRLASSPMSRGAVVLGRWGTRMGLGMVQIGIAMITGNVLFGVHWGPNLPMVVAVLLAYGALGAVLGLLLGNFGRTEAQVIGLGVIGSNLLAGLGGCWWPIEVTPVWTQKLAMAFPTGWTMDALHKLVNFGEPASAVVPHVCALLGAAAIGAWVLAKNFRFE